MATAKPTYPPLTITCLPAEDAYDYDHFRNRLADTSVLEHSVAIRIFRMPFLAVPAGGPRRGGYFSVPELSIGVEVLGLLRGRPGFTSLRLRWSPWRDCCHIVEWGAKPPDWWDDAARGRFYGYSATAISEFLDSAASAQRRPKTPSSTSPFRSPAGLRAVEEGP
ncbi:DUF6302 family protein [Streptomyces sp. NPDC059928]|uniref:DUF6302 family protein n=1 Tax=unclassified Streptomyces TaxID=2593676 RepID=UPI0036560FFE